MNNKLNESESDRIAEYLDLSPGNEPSLAIWIIGRPGAGKTTAGTMLTKVLRKAGRRVELVDGETVRAMFDGSLGHSNDERLIALNRVIYINRLLQSRGIVPITATIMGSRHVRDIARREVDNIRFFFLDCSFDVAARRDQKGLYARALAGQIKNFTDVDMPFESPVRYDLKIDSAKLKPAEVLAQILRHLQEEGLLSTQRRSGRSLIREP